MYLLCVFVSRGFWWQDLEKCALTGEILVLALLRTLLNGSYRSKIQVRLLRLVLLTGQWRFCKIKICIYIYRLSSTMYSKGACLFMTRVKIWSQKRMWTTDIMAHACWISTDINFTFYSFVSCIFNILAWDCNSSTVLFYYFPLP